MRVLLITGASGLLGQHVARQAMAGGWHVVGTYLSHPHDLPIQWRPLNVIDGEAIAALMADVQPNAVIHTAYRQSDPGMWEVTAIGAANVAVAAAQISAHLTHISSDMVFDGAHAPYDESVHPCPMSTYGAAKAAAETAVATVSPAAAIVRTSLIISRDPLDPQQRLVLDALDNANRVRFFIDEFRSPVAVEDLATSVVELAAKKFSGILNVAGPDCMSCDGLARLIATAYGRDPELIPAGSLAESGLMRPPNLCLDTALARTVLNVSLRPIWHYLHAGQPPT